MLEVRRLAADDDTHADDPSVAARCREMIGGLRQLERAGHPVHLDVILGDLGGGEGMERTLDQAEADALVEARGHDGVAGRRIRRSSSSRRRTTRQLITVGGSERRSSPTPPTAWP